MAYNFIYSLAIGVAILSLILMVFASNSRIEQRATKVFAISIAFLVVTYLLEMPGELEYFRARIAQESLLIILAALGGIAYMVKRMFNKKGD